MNQEKYESINLIDYLKKQGLSKNKIKTYIKQGFVKVDNQPVKKLPFILKKDSVVTITKNKAKSSNLSIIYEDKNYLVVDKENGLLTISTSKQTKNQEDTLYKRVRKYLNNKKEYAFIVNRIDKETSGLVIFVKNEDLKEKLQSSWNDIVKKRGYLAIVDGIIEKAGTIDNYLYEDKLTFVHGTNKRGKRAITNYRPVKHSNHYTMLDINISTGRKNQIRVHMSEMNHPIIGDKKYKCKSNPLKRLALHHYQISLIDPISKKLLTFESEIPNEFYLFFNSN